MCCRRGNSAPCPVLLDKHTKFSRLKAILHITSAYTCFDQTPTRALCPAGRTVPAKASEVVGIIFTHCALFHHHIVAFHYVGPSVVFRHVSPLCFPFPRLYWLSTTYALKATSRSKISALLECTVRRFESFCKTALEKKAPPPRKQ